MQARLLIAAGSIGAVLGKKGERIAELCQSSGASVTVHDSHEVPACGHSSDTLVTVSIMAEARDRIHEGPFNECRH